MSETDWDPTGLIAFGEKAEPTRHYAMERLGEIQLRREQGHDGKFFYVQANDPWLLKPADHAEVLDRPLYRSQRMLYPALAGGFGLFGPETIVWALLVVNLLAMGAGTWAVARIATEMGGAPWWGLGFTLNIGFVSEMTISGAGVVAAAAAFAAVYAIMRERYFAGIALLVTAALTREVMLLVAAGIAIWFWVRGERGRGAVAALVPAAAVGTWAIYLRARLGSGGVAAEVQEVGLPFGGLIAAFPNWLGEPVDLVVGVAMLLLLVLYTARVFRSTHAVAWAFIGFVPLAVVFTRQVWLNYFDITRALAPAITSFVLLVCCADGGSMDEQSPAFAEASLQSHAGPTDQR